jgi:putative DNA primase/helicase
MGKDVHRVIAELDAALGATDPLLYQRDHELVAVVGSRAKEGRSSLVAGTPILRSLTAATLLPRITEHVRTTVVVPPSAKAHRLAERSAGPSPGPETKDVTPSPTILSAFLGMLDWLHIRPIVGILEAPSLRPDGSVLQTPGYDEATGYLYVPSCEYPRINDEPTHSDAVLSYARLAEVFCDFPYVDPSHRSAVVASILALVGRPAILGSVPAFLFDASSRRSGKTLQVDVISLIASGRPAARMTYPVDDQELEKVLAGYALAGARMVNFDNVAGAFGGPALDKCITAVDTVDLRVLGASVMRTVTWRAVVFASGNNVSGRGDILERVLSPRLESPLEHPEKRDPTTLRHPNLRDWVRAHRTELVAHALVILRAYCAAGRPHQHVGPWGGFEAFTELVPAALAWCGAPDPLGARRGGDGEQDPTRLAESALLAGWDRLCASLHERFLTVSAALRAIYPPPKREEPNDGHDALREAIGELTRVPTGATPDARRVGEAIRKLRNKTIDGRRFVAEGATGGVTRWMVVRV